jgi:hypothetical protein
VPVPLLSFGGTSCATSSLASSFMASATAVPPLEKLFILMLCHGKTIWENPDHRNEIIEHARIALKIFILSPF